jgi:hypothetical protein
MRFPLLFSLVLISACDVGAPGQCVGEGGPFGPCPPDTHVCGPGLICLDALPYGTICGIDDPALFSDAAETCSTLVGKEVRCDFFDADCQVACETDADCTAGTRCSPYGACVWPQ